VRRHLIASALTVATTLASSRTASAAAWASVQGQVLDYTIPFNEPFIDPSHPQTAAPVVPKPIRGVIVLMKLPSGRELTTTTDSNGRFVLFGLAGADATIEVQWPKMSCRRKLHIAAGQVTYATVGVDYDYHGAVGLPLPDCSVEATTAAPTEQLGQITGVVISKASGEPVAGAGVMLFTGNKSDIETTTDRRGYFSALGIRSDNVELVINKDAVGCITAIDLAAAEDLRVVVRAPQKTGNSRDTCVWRWFVIGP